MATLNDQLNCDMYIMRESKLDFSAAMMNHEPFITNNFIRYELIYLLNFC